MALTELAAKQAKPKEKKYRLADSGGLNLQVMPNGAKYWRLRYRHPQTQKSNQLALGVYPKVLLKVASIKRDEAKELLSEGIDPCDHKKAARLAKGATAKTFGSIAGEWFSKQQLACAPAITKKHKALLTNDLLPYVGSRPINELETFELLGVLNRITDRGAVYTATSSTQTTEKQMRENPLGIYVRDYSWSRLQ